ncbi:MAG: hypothetical protein OEV94_12030 [Deltaproteobacteria bacterium]|nr:hypothetical protein [Deltaproteobacteria bacterium]
MAVYVSHLSMVEFHDQNGVPLAGGSLNSYRAGTTTPKATYADYLGVTPNPTSLTLDAAGRPAVSGAPVALWLKGGEPYKFVLKDALGGTVWTLDNIYGINDSSIGVIVSEWQFLGIALAYISGTSFSVAGDMTPNLTPGLRLKLISGATTFYGSIISSVFAVDITTVTVQVDGGVALTNPLDSAYYSILAADHQSSPVIDAGGKVRPNLLHNVSAQPYRNLAIKRSAGAPNNQVSVTADSIVIEGWEFTAVNKTADITVAGADGLDTGSEAASTWYHIWAIANVSNPTAPVFALLLSTSSTAPTMPAGYTLKQYLGAVRNDGASNFKYFDQADGRTVTAFEIAAAAAVDGTINLASFIPPNAKRAHIVTKQSYGSSSWGQVAISKDANLGGRTQFGRWTSGAGGDELWFTHGFVAVNSQSIYLQRYNLSVDIYVSGWEF